MYFLSFLNILFFNLSVLLTLRSDFIIKYNQLKKNNNNYVSKKINK